MAKQRLTKALACVNKEAKKTARAGKKFGKTARRQAGRDCSKAGIKRRFKTGAKSVVKKQVTKRAKARVVKKLKQTGERISLSADRKRKAMAPGQRISKTGKKYTETRRNRSDVKKKLGWI